METQVISRQQRRYEQRQQAKAAARVAPKPRRGTNRRADPLAFLHPVAQAMLKTSDAATDPCMAAVRKMTRYLLASELHKHTLRHQRGSWRSWPRGIGAKEAAQFLAEGK